VIKRLSPFIANIGRAKMNQRLVNQRLVHVIAFLSLAGCGGGAAPPSASAQLLPPVSAGGLVAVTAPTSGSPVRGRVTVTANASGVGPFGVAAVQFQLDGVNLGTPDTSAPYAISWDTRTTTNASHTLTAVATDTLGVQYTSDAVTVTVFNDKTPPTVAAEDANPAFWLLG